MKVTSKYRSRSLGFARPTELAVLLLLIFPLLMMSAPSGAVSFSPLGYEGDIRNLWGGSNSAAPAAPVAAPPAVAQAATAGAAAVNNCGNQLAGEQAANIASGVASNGNLNPDNSAMMSCLSKYANFAFSTGLVLPSLMDMIPSLPLPNLSAMLNIQNIACQFEQTQMSKATGQMGNAMPNLSLPQTPGGVATGGANTSFGGAATGAPAPNHSTGTGFSNPLN